MKKTAFILLLTFLFSFTACTKNPDSESSKSDSSGSIGDISLTDSMTCPDASVQFSYDNSLSYSAVYTVNPKNLDLETLAANNYYVKIDVTYEVYYEKDFEAPFDIGYLGAPDHDVHLVDPDERGTKNENLSTSTTPTAESISYVVSAKSLSNANIYLKFITYNLQNIVYFRNISITYTCQPTK